MTVKMTPELARKIARRMIDRGERMEDIAKEFDRSHAWLSHALRDNGVNMREEYSNAAAERGQKIAEDHQRGMTVEQLVIKYGFSKSHINTLIARHQVTPVVKPEPYVGIPAGKPYIPRRSTYVPDRKTLMTYARAREAYGDKTVRGM